MSTPEVLAIISGIFNILAGVLFVTSCVLFVGGCIVYVIYFGMPRRESGIALMEWGVATLLFFLFLLGLTRFFSAMPGVVNIVVSAVLIGFVLTIVSDSLREAPDAEKKKEEAAR